jgi:hypothetical protein
MDIDQNLLDEINSKMKPVVPPIDIVNSIIRVKDFPSLTLIGAGATGLNTGTVMQPYNLEDVKKELKKLNFGNFIKVYYDCEDRAFWGLAHLRHNLPGIPAGIASGFAVEGPVSELPDKSHAVLIIWYRDGGELKSIYYDPLPEYQGEVKFDPRIFISFPIGLQGDPMPSPVPSNYHYINNNLVIFDESRMVYELRRGDQKGLLDYLERGEYETACKESHKILLNENEFGSLWRDYDRSLWAFSHIRRAYPGCMAGIAVGNPIDGRSFSTVILWDKDLTNRYWDPWTTKEVKKFTPMKVFV